MLISILIIGLNYLPKICFYVKFHEMCLLYSYFLLYGLERKLIPLKLSSLKSIESLICFKSHARIFMFGVYDFEILGNSDM